MDTHSNTMHSYNTYVLFDPSSMFLGKVFSLPLLLQFSFVLNHLFIFPNLRDIRFPFVFF